MNTKQTSLIYQVRQLRYILPVLLVVIVVVYQLGVAQLLADTYGHQVHYGVEIAFYSLTGPIATWLTLVWVERNLQEKEQLEQQLLAYQRERQAIREEERTRIARDLHDGVAQTLYFLALKADMARKLIPDNPQQVETELQDIGRNTRQIIQEVRRTIFSLRPLDWTQGNFLPALHQFIIDFAEQMGWQTTINISDTLMLLPQLEPTIFRLVQESLNNVAKHARATHIEVALSITEHDSNLNLCIKDNGVGFQPVSEPHKGLGLAQMQKRVTAVSGTFHIDTTHQEGTMIMAKLPLKENGNETNTHLAR